MKTKITKIIGGPDINEKPQQPGTCKVMRKPNPYSNENLTGFIEGSDNPNLE